MPQRLGQPSSHLLAGAAVVLAGLFSAKDKTIVPALDTLAALIESHGGRVVARCIQRRGVSHGGVHLMSKPFSRRTLISPGKVAELAELCRTTGATAVVFSNPLTKDQCQVLQDLLGHPTLSGEDLQPHGGYAPRP
jgi:50S ribosomal subunit-associated GTPase HflX